MRAISLWQPWASLIEIGAKQYETRSWYTPYRGPLVIHAAKRWTSEEKAVFNHPIFKAAFKGIGITDCNQLPLGAAICTVDLVDCLPTDRVWEYISASERAFGNYHPGRFAWKLENVQRFDAPVPYKGAQGFFNYDYAQADEGTAKALKQLELFK